jgi:hypothetical protein
MRRHLHLAVRRVIRRLRPSLARFAGAAGASDPGPLLHLEGAALGRLPRIAPHVGPGPRGSGHIGCGPVADGHPATKDVNEAKGPR